MLSFSSLAFVSGDVDNKVVIITYRVIMVSDSGHLRRDLFTDNLW